HRTAGQYQVHCYMVKNDGNMVMLTSSAFAIASPELNMTAEDLGNGKFKISVEVANNPSGAKKVEIPVWSENNGQDDIIWYEANKDD
ncbi:GBS Bsp-like repeat-containing protein, partial [[Clostridium] spiroforme]|nr:GBS Bsp-like repeat-containing protein [Thomasclavelia spiroformis]